jgi:hypothetical protein
MSFSIGFFAPKAKDYEIPMYLVEFVLNRYVVSTKDWQ